jgi:hypothetical protein
MIITPVATHGNKITMFNIEIRLGSSKMHPYAPRLSLEVISKPKKTSSHFVALARGRARQI